MQQELDALAHNHTWDLVPLPLGKKPIGSKWVYKVKLRSDGTLERHKARLVAQGYNQKYGIDYHDTFSPVVKITTVRCLLALAAYRKWPLFQLDVNNAFLHGDLFEEVYMKIPDGLLAPSNHVCRLNKSLYGLKQSSRQWFARLTTEMLNQGFVSSHSDSSLFLKKTSTCFTIAAIYVDDIILTGNNISDIQSLKSHLHRIFSIKDLGKLHYFLGLEVTYLNDGIALTQRKFTNELLRDCGITDFHKVATPLPLHLNYKIIVPRFILMLLNTGVLSVS